jgi:hypothetical protein
LSSSKDLSKALYQCCYGLPPITDKAHTTAQRRLNTYSLRHEQALLTRQLANTAIGWHFGYRRRCVSKQHIKGDSETALTNFGCAEVLW